MSQVLRFEWSAFGRPYHAARVRFAPRARDSELHTHADFHEFMGVLTGNGEHLLPTGTSPLVAGDVVLVRPRDRHAIRGSAPDGLEFINVAFPSSAWQGFLNLTRTNPTGSWDAAERPVIFRARDAAVVADVFESALQRFSGEPEHFDLCGSGSTSCRTSRPTSCRRERPAVQLPTGSARACTAMRAEENLRGGVPRLLELAGVSPAHLSRTLRAAYGMTPTDYVAEPPSRAGRVVAGGNFRAGRRDRHPLRFRKPVVLHPLLHRRPRRLAARVPASVPTSLRALTDR